MLLSTTKPLRFLPLFVLAASLFGSALLCSKCQADTVGNEKIGDVRVGVYYLANSTVRQTYSSAIASFGLDYTVGESIGTSRTVIGVDYIQKGDHATKLQIVPVTISQQYYHTITGTDFTPYGEVGLGAYFLQADDPNNQSLNGTHNETAVGGFVGGGFDLTSSAFLDLRYHFIGNIQGDDPSGYELTVGLRF